jgi:hypothetical protein
VKPVRGNFRLNVWSDQYNFVSREVSDLVSLEVFFKVRRQIYGSVTQKITEKLEGRVDGTFT